VARCFDTGQADVTANQGRSRLGLCRARRYCRFLCVRKCGECDNDAPALLECPGWEFLNWHRLRPGRPEYWHPISETGRQGGELARALNGDLPRRAVRVKDCVVVVPDVGVEVDKIAMERDFALVRGRKPGIGAVEDAGPLVAIRLVAAKPRTSQRGVIRQ